MMWFVLGMMASAIVFISLALMGLINQLTDLRKRVVRLELDQRGIK